MPGFHRQVDGPVFTDAARFVRENSLRFLTISALVLVPCFWHRRIVATDLGSHVYNAWLAHLIRNGQVPGLWIARQWTNVLFDFLLSGFGSLFGLYAAEKIAVSLAVLIFFWGIFAFVSAATRRAPWFLLPYIALVTYGYTFHMGFFNYYLSLGLSFFGLAVFWRGKGWKRLIGLVVSPPVVMAHPIGLVWLASAAAYVWIAEAAPRWWHRLLLCGAAAGLLVAAHHYFWSHYVVEPAPDSLFWFNGADQLLLFGDRYWILFFALAGFTVICIAVDLALRGRERGLFRYYSIPVQLYALALLAVPMLPRGIHSPSLGSPIALLTERMTSVSAVLLCCLLGAMRPSRWHLAGSLAIAVTFFAFVYQDTAKVNRIEAQEERLVRTLPPNQRVLGTIKAPADWRILIQHTMDRACVGYCFSYGNYEPGSGIFRVRETPGNPYVLEYEDAVDSEHGEYVVQPEDLPVFQLYQCSASGEDICIRPLAAGEENDRLGVHPDED